jgi:hypothetical protein
VFRSISDGATLWDSVLPAEAVRLPVALAAVDRVLDHSGLLEVFRSEFCPDRGRRSIPMEVYLRLMYLKWSNRWGYGRLVEIVSGSITYKVFARIPIDAPVPDPSTLKHLTKRFRPETITDLNRVANPMMWTRSCGAEASAGLSLGGAWEPLSRSQLAEQGTPVPVVQEGLAVRSRPCVRRRE